MSRMLEPYQDASLPIEQRVEDLLARMTRAEKIGQLYQMFINKDDQAVMSELVRAGGLGSRILTGKQQVGNAHESSLDVEELNEIQRIAVEESRLGIPLIQGRDVIHGYRTVFPIPLALAASLNPELVKRSFEIAAKEAKSTGVHWSFAPMLDIARDPRWGRIIEGFGEDPYLCSKLAIAAVQGLQGDDPADPDHVLACAKHYIGYGGAEGGRDYNTSEITDTTLRNFYLPPFRAAIEAGVGSVMSGFHDLNGESASGSHYLLTELLKEECGFAGFVVSDWGSVLDLLNHRVAENRCEAAQLAFHAGVDMEMCSPCYFEHLNALIEEGIIAEERLDDACRRILHAKFRVGLFEHPYTDTERYKTLLYSDEHLALAREAAIQSSVLLQNKGNILPLATGKRRIAAIGPFIREQATLLGSWSPDGNVEDTQTLLDALREAAPQARIEIVSNTLSDEMLMEVRLSELVILTVGESNARNGEYNSVASLDLPAGQEELVRAVHAMGKPIVLVVLSGRPVTLTRIAPLVDAILFAWHPGSAGAAAIADLIFGKAVPAGKLPISYPRGEGQIPVHYNHTSTGKPFARYLDLPVEPHYPFGFGLSYTSFAYSNFKLDKQEIDANDPDIKVSAVVTNTGPVAGDEVVQCYVQDKVASITRPVRELKGFQRITLQPGEAREVSFTLGRNELGFYGRDGRYRVEPGAFQVWIGGDSRTTLGGEFQVVKHR